MPASRPVRVVHVGKFYPPVAGGMERVVQSLCAVTEGRLDSRVLAFNTASRTVTDEVDGVPVTRVGTWGAVGSVAVAPAFPMHLSRIDADVLILHEPNPWALLSYAAVRPRLPLAIWFHSDVVRPALQYRLFYAPIARPAYRAARRFLVSSPALAEHATALQPFRDRRDGHSLRHRRGRVAPEREPCSGARTRSAARPAARSCSSRAGTCPTRACRCSSRRPRRSTCPW